MYLNCSPSQLIVQFHSLQSGGSLLIGGGLETLPVVDHVVVLPCHLVGVLNDVAVASKELPHVLGMDGLQIKVLHSPDLYVHSKTLSMNTTDLQTQNMRSIVFHSLDLHVLHRKSNKRQRLTNPKH